MMRGYQNLQPMRIVTARVSHGTPGRAGRQIARRPSPAQHAANGAAGLSSSARPVASLTRAPHVERPPLGLPKPLRRAAAAQPPPGRRSPRTAASAQNRELLVADVLLLVAFSLYKQITAIIFLPNFPGWLAPLSFNPSRLLELLSFAGTLTGTWLAVGWLVGAYRTDATSDIPTALFRASLTWLVAMPVAAAQLVLLTAAEDGALVGGEGFASALPLAASGPGEPFVTAAGILGLMTVWRAYYTTYLDIFNWRNASGGRLNRYDDMRHFADALRAALLLSLAGCILLTALGQLVGEEQLELLAANAWQALGGGQR